MDIGFDVDVLRETIGFSPLGHHAAYGGLRETKSPFLLGALGRKDFVAHLVGDRRLRVLAAMNVDRTYADAAPGDALVTSIGHGRGYAAREDADIQQDPRWDSAAIQARVATLRAEELERFGDTRWVEPVAFGSVGDPYNLIAPGEIGLAGFDTIPELNGRKPASRGTQLLYEHAMPKFWPRADRARLRWDTGDLFE